MPAPQSAPAIPEDESPSLREAYLASRPTKRQERLCFWCAKPSLMRGDQRFCSPSCRYEEFHSRKTKSVEDLRALLLEARNAPPGLPSDLAARIDAALLKLT